jgi:hypothetical protein
VPATVYLFCSIQDQPAKAGFSFFLVVLHLYSRLAG